LSVDAEPDPRHPHTGRFSLPLWRHDAANHVEAWGCKLALALTRGEHTITGLRHADLQRQLPYLSSGRISRNLKRLRVHGLIKRVGRRYKYYVTQLGQCAILAGLKLRELLVPQFASPTTAASASG